MRHAARHVVFLIYKSHSCSGIFCLYCNFLPVKMLPLVIVSFTVLLEEHKKKNNLLHLLITVKMHMI